MLKDNGGERTGSKVGKMGKMDDWKKIGVDRIRIESNRVGRRKTEIRT